MPGNLLAATEAPTPLPQISTPRSACARRTAWASRFGDVRIVDRLRTVRAETSTTSPSERREGDEVLLERVARVIGGERDLHRADTASGRRASWTRAASTTRSTVKPNFFCRSLSGADAPKVCMPMHRAASARRSAPSRTSRPARPTTRAVTSGGRTASRYACVLLLEQLPRRHADDARLDALRRQLSRRPRRTARPRCRCHQDARRACRRRRRPGRRRPWPGPTAGGVLGAVERRQRLPREDQARPARAAAA